MILSMFFQSTSFINTFSKEDGCSLEDTYATLANIHRAVAYGSAPRRTSQNLALECNTVEIHSGLTIDHILWKTATMVSPFYHV